jgi:PAS domain S-box-containing protein
VAVIAVVLATAMRAALNPVWGPTSIPLVFYFAAVAVVAWYGRLGAAVAAIVLSTIAIDLIFMEPRWSFEVDRLLGSALVSFIFTSGCIAGAIEATHRANDRARSELAERACSEQALRESEARERTRAAELQVLMDAVPAAIWIARDPACRDVVGNVASRAIIQPIGGTAEESSTAPAADTVQPEVWSQGRPLKQDDWPLQRAARGEQVRDAEIEIRFPRGASHYLIGTATPLRRADGTVTGAVAAFVDITQRRRAEEALRESDRRFSAAFRASPDALIVSRAADGLIREVNESGLRLYGLRYEEAVGRSSLELRLFVNPGDRQKLIAMLEQHGRVRDYEMQVNTRHGGPRSVLLAVEPFDLEGEKHLLVVHRDLSERQQAEQAVRESERRFRELAESMPQLVWTAGADGKVDYYNSRIRDYAGAEQNPDGSWSWQPMLHPDDQAPTAAAWAKAMTEKQRYACEHRAQLKDGTYRWHLSRAVPMLDADGRVLRWFGTATDIHEQRLAQEALRESEERLQLALSGAGMGVWSWELATNEVTWSPELYRLFGVESFGGTVDHFVALLHPDDVAVTMELLNTAIAEHTFYSHEFRFIRKDGAVRWCADQGQAAYYPDGRPKRMTGVVRDITERKRTAQQLEMARDAALAASRAKDDFLATLSHELRTPLNPVLLVASEAARDPALPTSVRADFEMIATNVALEARLIDDLLDLNRITRGKIVLEPRQLDLHVTIRDALQAIREEITAKRLAVTFGLDATAPMIFGDPVRLRQVFWNVLKNAVKFTPERGTIHISTAATDRDETLEIRVRDSGAGMTPENVERAFEPFVQGESAEQVATGQPGLGLGLSISRALVESHGGQIRAESPGRGEGTSIIIQLPRSVGPQVPERRRAVAIATTPTAFASTPSPFAGRHVLLVEDHAATRHALATLLARRGCAVTVASSVAEARDRAKAHSFDLLISDLGLPDGDGCSLLTELRLGHPDLPAIAVSGYGMETDFARSRTAGFLDHLTKPVNVAALDQALHRLLTPPAPPG